MNSEASQAILGACRRLIRPLARLLLRYGISYREFSATCKECFVDVAAEEFGIRGRPTNISRISVATGISRKEVSRIRDKGTNQIENERFGLAPASIVLRGWYSDPEFVDSFGVPRALGIDGPDISMTSLAARYAGDVPVGAVMAELLRLGTVERVSHDKYRPLSPYFMPPNVNGQLFAAGMQSLCNLLTTIAYNTNPNHTGAHLFERYAWSNRLPEATRVVAHSLVVERATEFLSFFDKWFREHESGLAGDRIESDVGVGIYYFDGSKR